MNRFAIGLYAPVKRFGSVRCESRRDFRDGIEHLVVIVLHSSRLLLALLLPPKNCASVAVIVIACESGAGEGKGRGGARYFRRSMKSDMSCIMPGVFVEG